MIFHTTNWIVQKVLYPELIWRISTNEKVIYLTFDDGPIPEVTDFVLATLEQFNAKATFFCVGENIKKYKAAFQSILTSGNKIGNHTYNHMKGWDTENETYFENIEKCETELLNHRQQPENGQLLFRPPHGRIRKSQISVLRKKYKIVMWDVLSGDYSNEISKEECLSESIKHTKKGSIIVFHDSLKASKNMKYVLPLYLQYFTERGFKFESL